jgi:hypothetical protein
MKLEWEQVLHIMSDQRDVGTSIFGESNGSSDEERIGTLYGG